MAESYLFGKTFNLVGKALDISARRHNLIAGNIANMDTIGYKPRDLDFRKTLERAIAAEKSGGDLVRTHRRHFPGKTRFSVADFEEISQQVDRFHLDSVDIDREMTHLLENNIKYQTAAEMMLRKISSLKTAIEEGGK